jgi:hypothetical protein
LLPSTPTSAGADRYIASIAQRPSSRQAHPNHDRRNVMGKYFLAWVLGVPATVLVLVYLLMH